MNTEILNASYSSRSTAVRGAKRHGLEPGTFDVREEGGRYYVVLTQADVDARDAEENPAAIEVDPADTGSDETDLELESEGDPAPAFVDEQGAVEAENELAADAVAEANEQDDADANEAEQAVAADAADADDATDTAAKTPRGPTYKEIANYNRSTILKPLDFIHKFLSENPQLTRKQAVAALVEKGINYSTARTQYQRWFTKRKG